MLKCVIAKINLVISEISLVTAEIQPCNILLATI